eukprot:CAMPEP_0119404108 /NCGR_PEP_ID=MMETSP1334-20130426/143724_1 /TAXON_ID=127549 /ORGANISM="Calcidiscus leptoporus, Strain RCC1130" /LENGTH=93 /DNA_ID=CAMNT_0007428065 /DNA_START=205 /DNA_END=486 /DNA_ORIENTATION=-
MPRQSQVANAKTIRNSTAARLVTARNWASTEALRRAFTEALSRSWECHGGVVGVSWKCRGSVVEASWQAGALNVRRRGSVVEVSWKRRGRARF